MILNLKNKLIDKSLFRTLYIAFLCINMIPIINVTVLARVLLFCFGVWAIIIIINNLITQGWLFFKNRHNQVMILLFGVFFITYLINFNNRGFHNIVSLFFYAVCVFVLNIFEDENSLCQDLGKMCDAYIGVNLLLAFASNIMYIFQLYYEITDRAGVIIRIGVTENRLFGLYSSPNVGGTFMILGIIMVAFMLLSNRDKGFKAKKIFYGIFVINAFVYISLSLSRGTYLCASLVLIFFVFLYVTSNRKQIVFIIGKKVLCALLALLLVTAGVSILQNGMLYVANAIRQISNDSSDTNDEIVSERIESSGDISNKRFSIWKASYNLAKDNLLIGVGDIYTAYLNLDEENSLSHEDLNYLNYSRGNVHNGYLQIIFECGMFAFAIYIIYMIYIVTRALTGLYKLRNSRAQYNIVLVSVCVIVYMLLNNIVETNMALMGTNVFQAILWVFVGFVMKSSDWCSGEKLKCRI